MEIIEFVNELEIFGDEKIRTSGRFDSTLTFQASTLNHSDTSPKMKLSYHIVSKF
jgi:hypothetical protein